MTKLQALLIIALAFVGAAVYAYHWLMSIECIHEGGRVMNQQAKRNLATITGALIGIGSSMAWGEQHILATACTAALFAFVARYCVPTHTHCCGCQMFDRIDNMHPYMSGHQCDVCKGEGK